MQTHENKRVERSVSSKKANAQALARGLQMVKMRTPGWHNLMAGGTARRQWFAYWLRDAPLDGLKWLLFHICGLLPISFVSNLGGSLARFIVPRFIRDALIRSWANLHWLEPTWSEAQIHEVAARHFENVGRLQAEFSVLHRLMPSGRVSIENAEVAKQTMKSGPVILVGTHIGNWELIGPVLATFGVPVFDIFEAQPSRMDNYLALTVRATVGPAGTAFFARSTQAPRAALKWLRDGGTLLMFCDEAVKGISAAPFFGRSPHLNSNYSFAVRLARLSDATLLPFHVNRHPGGRFALQFHSPLKLPPTDDPAGRLLEDVVQLNAVIEPLVRAHLADWFWLGWGFSGVDYPPSGR